MTPLDKLGSSTWRSCLLGLAVLLHGCSTSGTKQPHEPQDVALADEMPEWQRIAMPVDVDRLGRIDQAWDEALNASRTSRFRRSISAEGRLLERDAAIARPAPAPGSYMCRLIHIGSNERKGPSFKSYEPTFCYVGVDDSNRLWLARQTGPLRRQGFLWEDDLSRQMIFLGALASGSKDKPPAYGDPARSIAGVFERIGPLRYRLVTPYPQGFKLEVMELRPAPLQPEE